MANDDLEGRIHAAIVRTLAAIPGAAAAPLAMGITPGWDSIGHMSVVMAIEAEFATCFPAYRLPELIDVAAIARVLREQAV
jgi:hypothetical protein